MLKRIVVRLTVATATLLAAGSAWAMADDMAFYETANSVTSAVPEPAGALLFAVGAAAVGWAVGRRAVR